MKLKPNKKKIKLEGFDYFAIGISIAACANIYHSIINNAFTFEEYSLTGLMNLMAFWGW